MKKLHKKIQKHPRIACPFYKPHSTCTHKTHLKNNNSKARVCVFSNAEKCLDYKKTRVDTKDCLEPLKMQNTAIPQSLWNKIMEKIKK